MVSQATKYLRAARLLCKLIPVTTKQPQTKNQSEGNKYEINSWEDQEFVAAVKATGRKKLIMCALWTEACLLFPALDALSEGYEVYPVSDAVGGTSPESHRAALERMIHAGAKPTTWISVHCELQRDWARANTVPGFVQAVVEHGRPGWFLNLVEQRQRMKK